MNLFTLLFAPFLGSLVHDIGHVVVLWSHRLVIGFVYSKGLTNYKHYLVPGIVSTGRMILEIQGSTSDFLMKLSTCLLVVRIYPIHIKMIGVVQWYVLWPILSFFCIIIIHTYVFKHGCACLKLEFGRFQIFQQIYQFEGTVEYWVRGT